MRKTALWFIGDVNEHACWRGHCAVYCFCLKGRNFNNISQCFQDQTLLLHHLWWTTTDININVTLIIADNRNVKWRGNTSNAKYSNNLPFALFGWGAEFLVACTPSSIIELLKIWEQLRLFQECRQRVLKVRNLSSWLGISWLTGNDQQPYQLLQIYHGNFGALGP